MVFEYDFRQLSTSMSKLIIVDDDPQILETLLLLLSTRNYDTACFLSAEEMLNSEDGSDCDCLIIDFRLPGMNGFQLIQSLRRSQINTPVILLSGNIGPAIAAQLDEFAAVTLLGKPCRGPQLLAAIDAAIANDVP